MTKERPKCSIKDCNNLAMKREAKRGNKFFSLCSSHHKKKYKQSSSYDRKKGLNRWDFPNDKCILCQWEGPCDRHRILMGKDGGKYVKGNVIILCPNCHRLLHQGTLSIK